MSNYLGDHKLSLLRTKYFYGQLDNGRDGCQNDTFYNLAKTKIGRNDGLQDVSDKILKGLCYVYKKSLLDNFESDICKFLYFWLGNILLNKMRYNFVFVDVILYLFNTLQNNKIGKICELPHHYMDVNNFKNIKLFFDYSEDYTSYKQQFTGHKHSCNREYKSYLDTYVNSYKSVRDECKKNSNRNSYCEEFNQYFTGKFDYDLSNWKCDLEENGRENQELEEDDEVADKSLLSPEHGMGVHHVINQNQFSSVREEAVNVPGSPGYILVEKNLDLNNISDTPDDYSPSTIKKSITSAASAAGLLVPPFLVYHFTPARSWINQLLGRNNMNRNPYANQELMTNFPMPGDFDSERNRYNIMYRPE
ncbi:PIR protein [Plasmodium vivax]|nr:PIR protein [Plasmodium vivax]